MMELARDDTLPNGMSQVFNFGMAKAIGDDRGAFPDPEGSPVHTIQ